MMLTACRVSALSPGHSQMLLQLQRCQIAETFQVAITCMSLSKLPAAAGRE
jgi:hypothetical protein